MVPGTSRLPLTILSVELQGSLRDWKTWKMKVVMEKSWNLNNWQNEICDQSWKFTKSASELFLVCAFSQKCCEC